MSGLKFNVEKARAIWIRSLSHSNRQLCREYKLDWSQEAFKILGVTFSVEVFDTWDLITEQIYNIVLSPSVKIGQKENLIFWKNYYHKILSLSSI